MVKKSQEKGVWAPHAPAKFVPRRKGSVSVDRRWKSHMGGSFFDGISQDSTGFISSAFTDCIDALISLKEVSDNSGLPVFSTPSENDNAWGRQEDYVDLKKQTQTKPKRKKYWPKLLNEGKPKKSPKPTTPKPHIPKPSEHATSKRCSDEKRKDVWNDSLPPASTRPSKDAQVDGQEVDATYVSESANQALSFNMQNLERDCTEDARIIIHQYRRQEEKVDRSSCDAKAIEQSKEGDLMVKNSTSMTFGFTPTQKWIQSIQSSETERGAANDPHDINETGCCNQISLKVYQRIFRADHCRSNSRKLGPNFPRMWKKRRATRRKAAMLNKAMHDTLKSTIAADDSQKTLKKGWMGIQKATNLGTRWSLESAEQAQRWVKPSNFSTTMTQGQLALQKHKANSGGVALNYLGRMILPTKSQSWLAANDCVLSLTPLATSKKKRSSKSTRRLVAKRQYKMGFLDNAVPDHNKVRGCPEYVLPSTESMRAVFAVQLIDVVKGLEGLHISNAGGQLDVQTQNDAHGKVGQHKSSDCKDPKFWANQCWSNSRKLGHNFPGIWKKKATMLNKSMHDTLKSTIAADDSQKTPKKRWIGIQKATNIGTKWYLESAKQARNDAHGKVGQHKSSDCKEPNFWANQCWSNSRKLGPNFPGIWKKTKMTRQKPTMLNKSIHDTLKSTIVADSQNTPKKGWIGIQKATNIGTRWSLESSKQARNDAHGKVGKHKSSDCKDPKFWANQCQTNSRKFGPSCPRIWKKTKMTRRKATMLNKSMHGTLKSKITADDSQKTPKKGWIGIQKATNIGIRWSLESAKQAQRWVKPSNFSTTMTQGQLALQKHKANSGGVVPNYLGRMISPTKSQSWLAANDCVLSLTPLATSKKRRSSNATRRLVAKKQYEMGFLDNVVPDHDNKVRGCPEHVLPSTESMWAVSAVQSIDVVEGIEGLHISNAGGQLVAQTPNDAQGKVGQHE